MPDFAPFEAKMRADGQPALAIEVFRHYYQALAAGESGLIPESSLAELAPLPDAEALGAYQTRGRDELTRLVVIKLNGGLGTSMGMERAKSLLPVKHGLRFLDLIATQVLDLRRRFGVGLPLVLMDSFRTQADSLAALREHPGLDQPVPHSFLQHRVPKVVAADLSPATHEHDELTWCPPGHGDFYPALATSGLLAGLLAHGYRYAFVSNADNLGASPDLGILGWMADRGAPFVMECADRTAADKKGGHLAAVLGDGLVLREVAQCPEADLPSFQDITRHRYFNTNNVWIDLEAVRRLIEDSGGRLGLPLIRNKKPLDPADPVGPGATPVIQLETAIGSAIARFPGAAAVRVPRSRFLPVKTTNDLLVVCSDLYALEDGGRLVARREALPEIDLDPRFYKHIEDFQLRIAHPPSLAEATRLTVRGDVRFGPGVVVRGAVTLEHEGPAPLELAGVVLEGTGPG